MAKWFSSFKEWRRRRNEVNLPRSRPLPPGEPPSQSRALRDAIGPSGPRPWFGRRSTWKVYDIVTEAADRYEDSFKKDPREASKKETD